MKTIRCMALLLAASTYGFAQNAVQDPDLPELHKIQTITLSPSYSCRPSKEFQQGYAQTALFLSKYSKPNSPDVVFNGACKTEDYFVASTGGDGFSLIADLGADVSLEDLSAARAFNLKRIHSFPEYSKFAQASKVIPNHTYAVVLNDGPKRGLFIFQVIEHVPNKSVQLRYAVKFYQIATTAAAGFNWDRTNK